jgi:hypothetical protein
LKLSRRNQRRRSPRRRKGRPMRMISIPSLMKSQKMKRLKKHVWKE